METSNYHGFNSIISLVRDGLASMLEEFGLADDWQVVRSNQSTIQAVQNNTVYFDVVSRRRYGVQGTRPVKTDDGWSNESIWYEEMLIQVSAFKQREPDSDTEDTLSSSDVIDWLQACVNSNTDMGEFNGGKPTNFFKRDYLQIIRSTDVREIDYETDSGLKEKMPQFDFLLVVKQRLLKNINKIDTIELETKRI